MAKPLSTHQKKSFYLSPVILIVFLCAGNPDILYAAGSRKGIYKSIDGGAQWELFPFPDTSDARGAAQLVETDPDNSKVIYSDYRTFSRSMDGGKT